MTHLSKIVERLQGLSLDQIAEVSKGIGGHYHIAILSQANSGDFSSCISLKVVPSSSEFGIIHVPKEHRAFFPGYRTQFVLETDVSPFVMHLTGGNSDQLIKGVSLDDAVGENIGQYLCHPRSTQISSQYADIPGTTSGREGSFKRFYELHDEIVPDDFLIICRRVKPRDDHYVLTRVIRQLSLSQENFE